MRPLRGISKYQANGDLRTTGELKKPRLAMINCEEKLVFLHTTLPLRRRVTADGLLLEFPNRRDAVGSAGVGQTVERPHRVVIHDR